LGRCLRLQGRTAAAERMLTTAAEVFEAARLRAGTGFARATFQESPYAQLAATRLMQGQIVEAWPACESALGRALADLLVVAGQRPLSPAEAAREDSLQRTLSRLERQLNALQVASLTDSTGDTVERFEATRTHLLEAEAAWNTLRQEVAAKYPIAEGRGYTLERVQQVLPAQTALVGWLHVELAPGESASWGYVIRATGPVRWVRLDTCTHGTEDLAYDESGAVGLAASLREALSCAASWPFRVASMERLTKISRDLWTWWVAPLTTHMEEVANLVVIPSGPMLGIPLEILVDSAGTYCGERYAISYAPSATVYAWLQEQPARRDAGAAHRALLVGDPPFAAEHAAAMAHEQTLPDATAGRDLVAVPGPLQATVLRSALAGNADALGSLTRLPSTRDEVERVASVMTGVTMLVGPDASEQQIVRMADIGELESFDTIHLATHALVDDERPEHSALVLARVDLPDPLAATLAGERIYDGLLTVPEIIRECRLDADLVTLSGCQTALGKAAAGEGYIGLAQAFLQVGARSLLVSLWKVDDEATARLMGRFYENLTGAYTGERNGFGGGPLTKSAALREAKRYLRDYTSPDGGAPFRHPAYWSGFVLIGESG
jgi:CHAT domain-containing protein